MARKKPYTDGCAAAHALDLIGERWALLVVRELISGALRFSDLKAALPGVSSNILSRRLAELEAAGVVIRRRLPPPASVNVYEATEWGGDLKPVIMELGRWAARSPGLAAGHPMSAASLVLSFQTMFSADRAAGMAVAVGLDVGVENQCACRHGTATRFGRTGVRRAVWRSRGLTPVRRPRRAG